MSRQLLHAVVVLFGFQPHRTLTRSARGPARSGRLNEAPGVDWRRGERAGWNGRETRGDWLMGEEAGLVGAARAGIG